MKYCSWLILIILSATTLYAGQIDNLPAQEPPNNIVLLSETVAALRQEVASQKMALEKQQKQIAALENSGIAARSDLFSEMEALEQLQKSLELVAEKLRKQEKKSEQTITGLKKELSELTNRGRQRDGLIEQQVGAIDKLQNELAEYKKNQAVLLQQRAERLGRLEETLKANKIEFVGRVEGVKSEVSATKTQLDSLGLGVNSKVKQLGLWLGLVALLGIIGIFLGVVLRKKLTSSSNQLEDNLTQMRTRMEEENVKLDAKLVELLQSQMKLVQEQPTEPLTAATPETVEVDHTLPLRVGAEILRLRQRIKNLPDETKGLRPMLKSLERLEDEFNKKGYELVDMLGKPFDDGLNVKARFIASNDLEPGENIISKVIKPQINFNGVSIQVAEIEVITGGE